MTKKVLIDNEAVPVSKTKTVISLNSPTPSWATWMFRIEFVLNKVAVYVLTSLDGLSVKQMKYAILIISAIDLATWSFGKFIGLKKDDFEK